MLKIRQEIVPVECIELMRRISCARNIALNAHWKAEKRRRGILAFTRLIYVSAAVCVRAACNYVPGLTTSPVLII